MHIAKLGLWNFLIRFSSLLHAMKDRTKTEANQELQFSYKTKPKLTDFWVGQSITALLSEFKENSMVVILDVFQYSSWSGDIRTSFKAVLVDLISSSAGRKQETVKVQEKFLVKPAEDR